jgi:histidinol-phosphate aminotransferase
MYRFRKDLENKEAVQLQVPRKRIMMSLNESSLNPLGLIMENFQNNLSSVSLNRYFSSITDKLMESLQDYIGYGISKEEILVGNGADQMLFYLFLSLRDKGENFALSLAPSYFDYSSYSSTVGLGFQTLTLNKDFDFSPQEFLAKGDDENCRLLIICYPNNPTGNLFPEEKILKVIKKSAVPVLLDETYYEFSGKTFMDKIADFDNLIILRSFSKSFSSAGVRFGYLVSAEKNIREIRKVFLASNLSLLVQTFAYSLLEKRDLFLEHNKNVMELRNKLFQQLNALDEVTVYPSETNFLIFSAGKKTQELFEYLGKNDISVRSMHKLPLLENHLRVTVSTEADNNYFLEKLQEFITKQN